MTKCKCNVNVRSLLPVKKTHTKQFILLAKNTEKTCLQKVVYLEMYLSEKCTCVVVQQVNVVKNKFLIMLCERT